MGSATSPSDASVDCTVCSGPCWWATTDHLINLSPVTPHSALGIGYKQQLTESELMPAMTSVSVQASPYPASGSFSAFNASPSQRAKRKYTSSEDKAAERRLRRRVDPSQRKRVAAACEQCKKRKQKVRSISRLNTEASVMENTRVASVDGATMNVSSFAPSGGILNPNSGSRFTRLPHKRSGNPGTLSLSTRLGRDPRPMKKWFL